MVMLVATMIIKMQVGVVSVGGGCDIGGCDDEGGISGRLKKGKRFTQGNGRVFAFKGNLINGKINMNG